jgi:hypothetical protein
MSEEHYLDRDALLALDLDPDVVDKLLLSTEHKGHGGRRVMPVSEPGNRLAMLDLDGGTA